MSLFGSDLKISVSGRVRYPDAFVTCTPVRETSTVVIEPVVVFEIISPSTSGIDRVTKNQEYRDTPSFQRYMLLEQDRQAATVVSRDHGDWMGHVISGDAALAMPEIGVFLPLAELFVGGELAIDEPDEDPSW